MDNLRQVINEAQCFAEHLSDPRIQSACSTTGVTACCAALRRRASADASSGVDLATPDFPALARSMGVDARAVACVDQFRTTYRAALQGDGPVLLDIDLNALHPIGEYPPRPR